MNPDMMPLPYYGERRFRVVGCGLEHGTDGGKQNPPVLSIARGNKVTRDTGGLSMWGWGSAFLADG